MLIPVDYIASHNWVFMDRKLPWNLCRRSILFEEGGVIGFADRLPTTIGRTLSEADRVPVNGTMT